MLDKVLETSRFVVNNARHVRINYDKTNQLIDELLMFDNVHYLTKVPYSIYEMSTKDIVNFLLIYDAIDFSFWGNPKWTINANGKDLDGGIALLHCIFNSVYYYFTCFYLKIQPVLNDTNIKHFSSKFSLVYKSFTTKLFPELANTHIAYYNFN